MLAAAVLLWALQAAEPASGSWIDIVDFGFEDPDRGWILLYDSSASERFEFFPAQWDPKLGIHVT